MIGLLQQLFDPAYLYALNPGPLGRWGPLYVTWAILLLAGLGAALWWRTRVDHRAATVTAWACGVGSLFAGLRLLAPWLAGARQFEQLSPQARLLLLEAWTARVWPVSATLAAVLILTSHLLSRLRLPVLLQCQVDALVGRPPPDQDRTGVRTAEPSAVPTGTPERCRLLPPWQSAILGTLHLAGIAWLWHLAGRPVWWAIPSLSLLVAPTLLARPRRPRFETMAPLLPAYLSALACYALSRRLQIDVGEYQGFALPDPWSPWFNVPALVTGGALYTLWIQLRWITFQRGSSARCRAIVIGRVLPITFGLFTALWLGGTVAVHRTHGVTASDPYCYVQMAIDLAETGMPLHDFPLAGLARDLELPTWPAVHIGYHPPAFGNRAPTMWSIGWPLLMVPFYWAGGLNALYLAAPLVSAGALIATWCMVNETLRDRPGVVRLAVAALTCFLVATSPEGSERILVPMSDAAAQLFTTTTLWLLLRGQRKRPLLHALLAGACFGTAYLVRHPQLPLGVAALIAVLGTKRSLKHRFWTLAAFGSAALVVVIPDFLYHRAVFGGWLSTESTEWFLISIHNVGRSLFAIAQQGILRREELGFLAPFALYGCGLLWRRHRRPAAILTVGFVAVLLFHLSYQALRPRDLIALLPVLYLWTAYGFVASWRRSQGHRSITAALWLVCCATLLFSRSYSTAAMPWREDVITFGHIRADQQQDLLTLRALTPENAVIGSMLNSGAIELHAERAAVHPAPWTEEELQRWADALLSEGRPFYVLDDGEEMPAVLDRLGRHYRIRLIRTLELPYFARGGGVLPHPASLYRIEQDH